MLITGVCVCARVSLCSAAAECRTDICLFLYTPPCTSGRLAVAGLKQICFTNLLMFIRALKCLVSSNRGFVPSGNLTKAQPKTVHCCLLGATHISFKSAIHKQHFKQQSKLCDPVANEMNSHSRFSFKLAEYTLFPVNI